MLVNSQFFGLVTQQEPLHFLKALFFSGFGATTVHHILLLDVVRIFSIKQNSLFHVSSSLFKLLESPIRFASSVVCFDSFLQVDAQSGLLYALVVAFQLKERIRHVQVRRRLQFEHLMLLFLRNLLLPTVDHREHLVAVWARRQVRLCEEVDFRPLRDGLLKLFLFEQQVAFVFQLPCHHH